MWLKEANAKCCEPFENLAKDLKCFLPDLYEELEYLHSLHKKSFVRNQRILSLAKAKAIKRTPRFVPICPCRLKKPVEVVHLEQRENTRTEQLAYPKVR